MSTADLEKQRVFHYTVPSSKPVHLLWDKCPLYAEKGHVLKM